MTRDQRNAYIVRRAHDLAVTRQYRDYLDIENVLVNEGYLEAQDYFDKNSVREEIRQLCVRHQQQ